MVVIFGFGPGHPEDLGEVASCVCPNCHNQVLSDAAFAAAKLAILEQKMQPQPPGPTAS
jgi:hypothetical protein